MEVLTASLKLQILIPRELFVTRNLELNLLTDNNKQINMISSIDISPNTTNLNT
jgi:hypothetical protein